MKFSTPNLMLFTSIHLLQNISKTWSSLSDLQIDCKYDIQGTNCSEHIYENFAFFQKLLYVRDKPHTEAEYKSLNQTNVISKIKIDIDNSGENYNIWLIDEAYEITVSEDSIHIFAWNSLGASRAFASLIQLMDMHPVLNEDRSAYALFHAQIYDKAAFPWRLLAVDGASHYMTVKHLKHQIDAMAIAKLNALHLRFSDDSAFPLQFQEQPQKDLIKGAYNQRKYFYPIEDLKGLEMYAFKRGVFFYVEMSIPGHSMSWKETDPKLLCNCPNSVAKTGKAVLNPLHKETFKYIDGAMREILLKSHHADLKSKPIIHLGGNDVNIDCFEEDPQVKEYMKKFNVTSAQIWRKFHSEVHYLLRYIGITGIPVYWEDAFNNGNEIIYGSVVRTHLGEAKDGVVRLKIAQAGHRLLSSSGWDLTRSKPTGDGHQFFQDTWQDLYKVDIMKDIPAEYSRFFLGGGPILQVQVSQGTLNSQDQQIWPRSIAIAEVLWSDPKSRDTPRSLRERFEEFSCKFYLVGIKAGVLVEYKPCFGFPLK